MLSRSILLSRLRLSRAHVAATTWLRTSATAASGTASSGTSGASSSGATEAPVDVVTVNIDGCDVQVHKDMTVLQACEAHGVHIPRFCYHDRLSIAGNCRMCLVEVVKSPKPVASCAMPLLPGMQIKTDTPKVKKAREGVMEFLLANHPLDCPICDQGGECDLQDLSMTYGSDRGRFNEFKRTVEDKNLGPFVKTIMTRCIHCTRCVRFAEEIAGVPELGVTGRGNTMEVGTYVEKPFDSELSGNIVDLCPVGALTSKPFAFTSRPWELIKTPSIDVHDALGSNIRIDSRGHDVMRIQPRVHEEVNEEWLSDRSRFSYDGLRRQRLDTPMIRSSDGKLVQCTWPEALSAISEKVQSLQGRQMRAIAGDLVDAEGMIALKDFMNRHGSTNVDCRQDGANLCADHRSNYLLNTTIAGIEDADVLLLVGTNPRMEAPVLNARIRKCSAYGNLRVASIGPEAKLTYDYIHLGDDASLFEKIAKGSHGYSKVLEAAEKPMVLFGQSVFRRPDADAFQLAVSAMSQRVKLFQEGWMGANVLQLAAARTAGLDLGLVPGPTSDLSDIRFVYLLGADDFFEDDIAEGAFVVYQGHTGDVGASIADVVLPSTAYTENSGTYVNTEGRVQRCTAATAFAGDVRPDWQILRALSEVTGKPLPYSTIDDVRQRIIDVAPHFAVLDRVDSSPFCTWEQTNASNAGAQKITPGRIEPAIENFFFTNSICRSSRNMARASHALPNSCNSYMD